MRVALILSAKVGSGYDPTSNEAFGSLAWSWETIPSSSLSQGSEAEYTAIAQVASVISKSNQGELMASETTRWTRSSPLARPRPNLPAPVYLCLYNTYNVLLCGKSMSQGCE